MSLVMYARRLALSGVVCLAAACQGAGTKAQLEEMALISAQKDSLLQEVLEHTRVMSEIGAELATVQGVVLAPESPSQQLAIDDDRILQQIRDLTERVTESGTRLEESQVRIRRLSNRTDSLGGLARDFEASIANLQAIVKTQQGTIDQLNARLYALRQENEELAREVVALVDTVLTLEDTVSAMLVRENTVYYIVGTKNDLKERGIVVEEGSKFLFIGKKTLVPARELNPEDFTEIDRLEQRSIAVPDSTEEYRIVSRQALAYLGTETDKDGKFRGDLVIDSPDAFWGPSKYLIIVEQ
jgi:chromosome segregation ATPase